MARIKDRRVAIKLRTEGKTYTFIKNYLGVNKSTLSYWIKHIKLTPRQIANIKKDAISKRVEAYIDTTRKRRKKVFDSFRDLAKKRLLPISKREFLIAGFFLYLGEGSKSDWWRVELANSDPSIIQFFIFWLTNIIGAEKRHLRVATHLYKDMDVEKELDFWRKITKIPRKQFWKPYIKKTSSTKIDHPTYGHGTCKIYLGNVKLKHEIIASIFTILEAAKIELSPISGHMNILSQTE